MHLNSESVWSVFEEDLRPKALNKPNLPEHRFAHLHVHSFDFFFEKFIGKAYKAQALTHHNLHLPL
jgi:hypothetical protein